MQLKKFWDKAIEYYCTSNSTERAERFDTIFIAIAEESLEKVKEKYLKEENLTALQITLIEQNILNAGGIVNSYYATIIELHNDLNNPSQYSFLRFSILVIGAFKQDDTSLRDYWKYFDPFLKEKKINLIRDRTDYINAVIKNLSKRCYSEHQKTFFQLNVFGEKSGIVNVGRIKAHSVFQGRTLEKIKKSIYSLGYSDSHNIEDLNFEDVELIIKESGLTRISNLFSRDKDAKEVVFVCLKIWMKNWIPNQEEKVKLLLGKSSIKKAPLSIQRLWFVNREKRNIEIKYAFIYRSELGEEGIYFLNKDENVYIDSSWAVRLSDNRVLYIIENYSLNSDLNKNELGLQFVCKYEDFNKNAYALEKIQNRDYFIELQNENVKIKDNAIILASRTEVAMEEADHIFDFPLANQDRIVFKLYRINDSLECLKFKFIKTNFLNISPVGISDGRSGHKSFLSSFPIKIKFNNLSKGEIHILKNDNIINKIELNKASNKLESEKIIGKLESGYYNIKYLDHNKNYLNFQNGEKSIDFEIVETGIRDRRVVPKQVQNDSFNYHEFRYLKHFDSLDNSSLIIFSQNELLEFKEVHSDFYFTKSDKNEWCLKPNKSLTFIQPLIKKPIDFREVYASWIAEMEYLSKSFKKYKYKIQYCERPETVSLPFNLSNYYHRDNNHRINQDYIKVNCYYYKLIKMDGDLSIKYPDVRIGDIIYVISNKSERMAEKFLQLLNQEFFPFKKVL